MNKNAYIKAVDNITAPEALVKKIEALDKPVNKKRPIYKTVTAFAACFVAVVIAFSAVMGTTLSAKESDAKTDVLRNENIYYGQSALTDTTNSAPEASANGVATAERKIVKTAQLSIRTKNYDMLMTEIKRLLEEYQGYIEQSHEYNHDSVSNRSANIELKIPADKLEMFIQELSAAGTVISKSVSSDDITDSYIDVESRINALETEEKTLLAILEKAETLTDIIELQERISVVRADLEAMKAKKHSYDSMVAYSDVSLDISEVERVIEGDDSFFGQVKEKLMNNLYDMGDFFRVLAINLIASLPYLALVGAVAAVVLVIVKKKRKK